MTQPQHTGHGSVPSASGICRHGWTPTPGKRGDYCRPCRRSPEHDTKAAQPAESGPPEQPSLPTPLREYVESLTEGANNGALPVHRLAEIVPPMSEAEYQRLKADIAEHGVRLPVFTLNGQILDGRHRAQACRELGREYPTQEVSGDPAAVVASLNLHRRHLQPDQVAAIHELLLDEMSTRHVAHEHSRRTGRDSAAVGKKIGVSSRTVDRAREVRRKAPEKLRAVAEGKTRAAKVLREAKSATKTAPRASSKTGAGSVRLKNHARNQPDARTARARA